MARVQIPEENCEIREPAEIKAFLKQYGIEFEQWDVEGRIGADATNEEILEAYSPGVSGFTLITSAVTKP